MKRLDIIVQQQVVIMSWIYALEHGLPPHFWSSQPEAMPPSVLSYNNIPTPLTYNSTPTMSSINNRTPLTSFYITSPMPTFTTTSLYNITFPMATCTTTSLYVTSSIVTCTTTSLYVTSPMLTSLQSQSEIGAPGYTLKLTGKRLNLSALLYAKEDKRHWLLRNRFVWCKK